MIQKSGSYFSFDDERLGQGRHNAAAFLREHPDVTQKILGALQAEAGPDQVVSARLLPIAEGDAPPAAAKATARRRTSRSTSPSRRPRAREGQRAGVMPVVSGLRELPSGRVAVELDGARWRTVPAEVVVRVRLGVGEELDRPRARELARELRRARAVDTAAPGGLAPRAVHGRARPPAAGERGFAPGLREETLEPPGARRARRRRALRDAPRGVPRRARPGGRGDPLAPRARRGRPGDRREGAWPPCRPSGSARGSSWPRRAPGSGRHASSPAGASARTRSRRRSARSLRTRPEAR